MHVPYSHHVFFTHIRDRAKDRYIRFYANEQIKMHKMSIFYTVKSLINILIHTYDMYPQHVEASIYYNVYMLRIFPLKFMKHINKTKSVQDHILFNFE